MNPSISVSGIRPAAWWQFIQCQWLNLVRMPAYSLPTLLFPVMFYAFFGLVMIRGQAHYLLATFATFGIMGAALFSFGVGIATERAQGWFTLLRATPAPLAGVVTGKWFGAALFAAVIVVMMEVLAAAFGGVRMHRVNGWGWSACWSPAPCRFACWVSARAADVAERGAGGDQHRLPAAGVSFRAVGAGLAVPALAAEFRRVAAAVSPRQLALHAAGVKPAEVLVHVLVLAGFSAAFSLLVIVGWRRMQQSP